MQVLIVVPYMKNINIITTFLKKFFDSTIDVIHPELSDLQYLKIWIRTKNANNCIVVGTKKSIFLPFLKLGLIIIFEEHSLNYKNLEKCRYNAKEIAILRAFEEKIPIILDSDTPSLKTLYNIFCKKFFLININSRKNIVKINSDIIDLKKERVRFKFSISLIHEIQNNFKDKQVLLLFNKFNLFFLFLRCKICFFIFKCNSCHFYFEFNQYHNILFCRFCLIKIKKPLFCYHCGHLSLTGISLDIQEIKNMIQKIFPNRKLIFLLNKKKFDKNTFNKKNFELSVSTSTIIFIREEIVQNYYFPHVHLISFISVDNHFFSFRFQNMEYFIQFYFNLINLTKYKNNLLKIIIQQSNLFDVNLKKICSNKYHCIANKILSFRKKLFLPPWTSQIIIYTESNNIKRNIIFLNLINHILKKKSKIQNLSLCSIGPDYVFHAKKNKYLYQLLIQSLSRPKLNKLLNECLEIISIFSITKRIKWFIDIDPV